MLKRLIPGQPAPALQFETLRHGTYDLAEGAPAGGTLVAFHRGRHCKWGRNALKELDDRIGDFAIRGLRVVALSGLDADDTAALQEQMQLVRLPLGHSVDLRALAETWGVNLTAHSSEEGAPDLHFEPAQFWVKADGILGLSAVQSAPLLHPDASNLLRAIDATNRHPMRGTGP